MFVELILLADCNFSCDYCIAGSNTFPFQPNFAEYKAVNRKDRTINSLPNKLPQTVHIPQMEIAEKIRDYYERGFGFDGNILNFEHILEFAKTKPDHRFVISGGEPLIYPNIDYWLSQLLQTHKVTLLTNAEKIHTLKTVLEHPNLSLRIGFHPEQRSLEKFEDIMAHISSKTDRYTINLIYHPRYLNGKFEEYKGWLEERKFNFEVTPFDGNYKGIGYNANNIHPEIEPHIDKKFTDFLEEKPEEWVGDKMFYIDGRGVIGGCAKYSTGHGLLGHYFSPERFGAETVKKCYTQDKGCNCSSIRIYGGK